jgi:predicted TIM-barrel fold metal-dependent hydrolase
MAIDVHIHSEGTEDPAKVLQAMDRVGLDRIVLLGVPPHESGKAPRSKRPHKSVIDTLAKVVKANPERLVGFAWIEPTLADAVDAVDYALDRKQLHGVKMIPNKWYPADERAQACYAKINEYGRPMLFHTGILWGTSDTSQYCRPAFYEIMFHYPRIRFAMAHMSWPWTDECIAVNGKFKANQTGEWTSYIEITSGAPPMWKVDALRKAFGYLGDEHIMFGSDSHLPEGEKYAAWRLREDEEVLREAGASDETVQRVLSTNALRWLGIG